MNVSLTPELEKLIEKKVESGMYHTASEVVREGLRLLDEQDQLRELQRREILRKLAEADEDIKAGRVTTYASVDELARDVRRRAEARLSAKPVKAPKRS